MATIAVSDYDDAASLSRVSDSRRIPPVGLLRIVLGDGGGTGRCRLGADRSGLAIRLVLGSFEQALGKATVTTQLAHSAIEANRCELDSINFTRP